MRSIRLSGKFETSFIIEDKVPDPEKWERRKSFRCRHCSGPAYIDPDSNSIWGCPGEKCSYSTEIFSHFFKPVFLIDEEERQKIVASD